jgi:hypothetical protein
MLNLLSIHAYVSSVLAENLKTMSNIGSAPDVRANGWKKRTFIKYYFTK